jgi:hypothetical protein
MRHDPYVGVTGFMTRAEVDAAVEAFKAQANWRDADLMIGVLASSKTLAGGTNKWPNRYPKVGDIASLFPLYLNAFNLIHYATDDRSTLADQLKELVRLGGQNLHGFQLNIRWPEPAALDAIPKGMRVVLQLGRGAIDEVDDDPIKAAKALGAYKGTVTDVLIDMSGGRGRDIDVVTAARYVEAIDDRHPDFGIGVAGGLSSGTILRLAGLANRWPMLSIDAEGRLRTPQPEDRLDIEAVKDYLDMADVLFD